MLSLSASGAVSLPLWARQRCCRCSLKRYWSPCSWPASIRIWALLLVATLEQRCWAPGSTGCWAAPARRYRERRWFPVSPARLEQAQAWYARYGRWSLLLNWMLVIGDPLTLVAGVMRERLWVFLLIVTLAKTGRYAVLAALTLSWT